MAKKLERGRALNEAILKHLAGPDSPIGEPVPLDGPAIAALESALGVALSPSMHALLAYDAAWAARQWRWRPEGAWAIRSALQVVEEFAGPFFEAYAPLFERRFPGNALPLDGGDDTLRLLYLGDPDALGEYPVLGLDHDDEPTVDVADGGFDCWLARDLGLVGDRTFAPERKATSKRLWNRQSEILPFDLPKKLPAAVAGPAPGSVVHVLLTPPATKKRKLSDSQLAKALKERAEDGGLGRLAELVAEAEARGLGAGVVDAAMVAAAHADQPAAVKLLLAAGANPNARDYYGAALSRAMWAKTDEIHEALLAAGADPNGPSVLGNTALHEAVEQGRTSTVAKLLAAGGDVRRRNEYLQTALNVAVSTSVPNPVPPIEILDLLLDAGADPSDPERPPLLEALREASDPHVLRLLDRGADPNLGDAHGRPLHVAFERGRDGIAGELIRRGADRSRPDERGITLDGVYGPDGADARPVHVRWADATGAQKLTVELTIAVLNPWHTAVLKPGLQLAWWKQAGQAGLLGGAKVSGKELDLSKAKAGLVKKTWALTVEGASPAFVRWMLAGMLADGGGVLTGAGFDLITRVVGLSAEGSAAGPSAISGDEVRASARDCSSLFARPAAPFPIRRDDGAPGIRVRSQADPAKVGALLLELAAAWMGAAASWPVVAPGSAWMAGFQPTLGKDGAEVPLIDLSGSKRAPSPWPWDREVSAAALEQVLVALHAEHPLLEAAYALPR